MPDTNKVILALKHHLILDKEEDQCVGCPYYDLFGTECMRQLYKDAKALIQDHGGAPDLPGTRFRTTTGDWFTVGEISGPSCTVTQERTGYTYHYETAALLKLPVTWEGGPTNEKD